ncbi:MAG: alpha/beta hydrolase [Clostridia bacterium]|nr:alpha/beta hydrolase [Clostridia bacterium]
MKSIYKSENAKNEVLALYDKQLQELNIKYNDLWIDTSFGKTHIIECGNLCGKPLLIFHGGNATTTYNLKDCFFLLRDFHIYAVDTIGHTGKSADVSLSPYNHDYGNWAVEIIRALAYEKIACLGGSFGAGIIVKLMCVAPDLVERCVLIVPSAIHNAPTVKSINMAFAIVMYKLTHKEKWFIRCMLPMAIKRENISDDLLTTARCSIDNTKIKSIMPKNEKTKNLCKYCNSVLIMAAEKDCLFPAKQVIKKAKKVWNKSTCYLLKDRGHIHNLTVKEKKMIVDFLLA